MFLSVPSVSSLPCVSICCTVFLLFCCVSCVPFVSPCCAVFLLFTVFPVFLVFQYVPLCSYCFAVSPSVFMCSAVSTVLLVLCVLLCLLCSYFHVICCVS